MTGGRRVALAAEQYVLPDLGVSLWSGFVAFGRLSLVPMLGSGAAEQTLRPEYFPDFLLRLLRPA
mgnify:CR=1 FL=1